MDHGRPDQTRPDQMCQPDWMAFTTPRPVVAVLRYMRQDRGEIPPIVDRWVER
jgi:hypothetical protein